MQQPKPVLIKAVERILQSLLRITIRYGISIGLLSELMRRVMVEVVEEQLISEGKRPMTTRVAAITGLNRKEVGRIKSLAGNDTSEIDDRYNRSTRVITGWMRDNDFRTRAGQPAVLAMEGEGGFVELVLRYSGDMTPRAMLEELLRVQAVERTSTGKLRLQARGYIPQASELDKLQILGTDTSDLLATIDHNLNHPPAEARFQRKVMYDDVPLEHAEEFRKYSAKLSMELLVRLDKWLSSRDREVNPEIAGTGKGRVGLGIYMFSEALEDPHKGDSTDE